MTEYEKHIKELEIKDPELSKIQQYHFDKFIPAIELCEKIEKSLTNTFDKKQSELFTSYRNMIDFTVTSILIEQMTLGIDMGIKMAKEIGVDNADK